MRGAFKIAGIRGINLFVHWTFLFLVGWVILVNTQAGNSIEQIVWSLLFVAAVFACVTLHEFGHALTAGLFGIKAKSIVLLPIGGIASIEKFPDNPRQELLISFAGPLVNIAIALLLLPFLQPYTSVLTRPADISITHGHDFLYNLYKVNIGLALFNLIPAFPMDGGRILRALIGFRTNYVRATAIAAGIGKIIAILFIAAGIFFLNFILALIGVFIIFSASMEEYYLRLKALVKGIKLKEVLMYDYNSLQAAATIKEAGDILINNHSKYFIVMDAVKPLGTVSRIDIVKAMADMNYDLPVRNIVKENLDCLEADTAVEDVLEKLAANDERIFPVMENGQFKGVVNFNHIIEYLLIHQHNPEEYNRVKSLVGLL